MAAALRDVSDDAAIDATLSSPPFFRPFSADADAMPIDATFDYWLIFFMPVRSRVATRRVAI